MPSLPWWFLAVFVLGINFAIWGTVGVIRLMEARSAARNSRRARHDDRAGASVVKLPRRPATAAPDLKPGAAR